MKNLFTYPNRCIYFLLFFCVCLFTNANAQIITTVAGSGPVTVGSGTYAGDGGPATSARFDQLTGVAIDRLGNIFVADQHDYRIRKVNVSGIVTTVAGTGTAGFTGDGGAATAARIDVVFGIALDTAGNLLIAEYNNQRIRKITTSGVISTIAGTGTAGYNGDSIMATAARLYNPYGIVVDSSGNIFVADSWNYRVRKIRPTGMITTFAGTGTAGFAGDGSMATSAMLAGPYGLAIDRFQNVYIADYWANHIRKVTPGGLINSIAGVGSQYFGTSYGYSGNSGDGGPATNASIGSPIGVATDKAGNVFFTSGLAVRKISEDGVISNYAGTGSRGFGGDGGLADTSIINYPWGIATDDSGNVFFADQGNYRVRKLANCTPIVAPITGPSSVQVGDTVGLYDTTIGGTWECAASSIATVSTSGVLFGLGSGTVVVSYSLSNSCGTARATKPLSVTSSVSSTVSCRVIRRFAGTGTIGYSGDGGAATAAQLYNNKGVAADKFGNVYVADYANNRIRKISTSGIIKTIAGNGTAGFSGDGSTATAAMLKHPWGVAVDTQGNVYIADRDNFRVRRVSTAGVIRTVAGTGVYGYSGDGGQGTAGRLKTPNSVAIDANGNLYIADQEGNRIRMVSASGVITTFAGTGYTDTSTGLGRYSGDGGPATNAELNNPYGVAVDGIGRVYISDSYNGRIRMVDTNGIVNTIGGNGVPGFSGDEGPATAARIDFPSDLAVDNAGNLFFSDEGNYRIRMINSSGIISTLTGSSSGVFVDGGPANLGGSAVYYGVGVDRSGNVYPSLGAAGLIYKISTVAISVPPIFGPSALAPATTITLTDSVSGGIWSSGSPAVATIGSTGVVTGVTLGSTVISYPVTNTCGTFVETKHISVLSPSAFCNIISTLAGNGTSDFAGDGGPATDAEIQAPAGVAADTAGNIYVTDLTNQRVRKVSSAGIITTIAGNGLAGHTGDGGAATAARINGPWGVAVDLAGNVYIAEGSANRIRKVTPSGIISTLAGIGTSGFGGDGGPSTAARLSFPIGVAVDGAGNVYIADVGNERIRKISTSGVITTVAGRTGGGFSGDGGHATAAKLNSPEGVYVDAAGNIYIADNANNRIRKVNAAGIITTVAGIGTIGYSGDGGPATAAELSGPNTVSVDGGGNIFIADVNNNVIRIVSPAGIINTIAGTGTPGYSGDGGSSTASQVNHPTGVATDVIGNVYVADVSNFVVRKISRGAPVLATIVGPATVCRFDSISLSNAIESGLWTVSDTTVAHISDSGMLTGRANGVVTVNYSITNSCGSASVTDTVRVLAPPTSGTISGPVHLCAGSTATLRDTTASEPGVWSITGGFATLSSTGLLTAISPGADTVLYTVTGLCGTVVSREVVFVDTMPVAGHISGPSSVCSGVHITLTDAISGGSWMSSDTTIALVDSFGIITGRIPESVPIIYSFTNGCGTDVALDTITVLPLPHAGSIVGVPYLCLGNSSTLIDTGASSAGTWSSRHSYASIGSGGLVTTVAPGYDTLEYSVTNSCGTAIAQHILSVHARPSAGIISGVSVVCSGASITLTNSVAGGAWSATNPFATVSAGLVSGISVGVDTIIYSVSDSFCANATTAIVTVALTPDAGTISGLTSVCEGMTITLTDAAPGGAWVAMNAHASVASGVVSGITAGTDTIAYVVSTLCGTDIARAFVIINQAVLPTLTIDNPHDTPCAMLPVTLSASYTHGGSTPTFAWQLNGVAAGIDSTFTFAPHYGDIIHCTMMSSAQCRLADSVTDAMVSHMNSPVTPFVSIKTMHDTIAYPGQIITFDAMETYGGANPQYQWFLNGVAVPGATDNSYSVETYSNDTVWCQVTSSLPCISQLQDSSNTIVIHTEFLSVGNISQGKEISLIPNPNNGNFRLLGALPFVGNNSVHFQVCDVMGREIYVVDAVTDKGHFDQLFSLDERFPAGQYFIRIQSDAQNEVVHFLVGR